MRDLMTLATTKAAADLGALLTDPATVELLAKDVSRTLEAQINSGEDKPLRVRISCGVVVEPRGKEADVRTTIKWGVSEKHATDSTVDLNRPLPGMEKEAGE